jgi:hypothetical protein
MRCKTFKCNYVLGHYPQGPSNTFTNIATHKIISMGIKGEGCRDGINLQMDQNHLYVQGYHENMPICKEMGINYIWD